MRTLEDVVEENMKDKDFQNAYNYWRPDKVLSDVLIAYRIRHDLTIKELAKILKISNRKLVKIEAMSGNPSLKLVKKIAELVESDLNIELRERE